MVFSLVARLGLFTAAAAVLAGALLWVSSPKAPAAFAEPMPFGDLLSGRTIVIDPGHGGWDPGSIGNQAQEDQLNLQISLQLRKWFQAAGARVVMTWSKPSDIPPQQKYRVRQRVEFINSVGADALIDIHCNASNPAYSGPQTFYWDGVQSYHLARDIQEELQYLTHTRRQIQRLNQYVLRYANMPAVNVEVGFITNPREERQLMTPAYQRQLTWAIFVGTERWLLKGRWPANLLKMPLTELIQR